MTFSRLDSPIQARQRLRAAVLCLLVLVAPPSIAQEFSYGPITAEWFRGPSTWDGKHVFLDLYCAEFPDPQTVASTSEGLLGKGGISYFRVVYKSKGVIAYIVTSTVPSGTADDVELQRLLANDQRAASTIAKAYPDSLRYRVATSQSPWGTMIKLHQFNVAEQSPQGIFPLASTLLESTDGPPHSQSAHRMLVRGSNRFEVAVLGIPDDPDAIDAAAKLEAKTEAFADQVTSSLLQCTQALKTGEEG